MRTNMDTLVRTVASGALSRIVVHDSNRPLCNGLYHDMTVKYYENKELPTVYADAGLRQ